MAEDFAIGKALVIPQSVLNNINKLDEKINLIASDSEKMATHFLSAMTRMGGNAGELLDKLQNINNVINNIGSINAKGIDNVSSGLGKTNTEAEKVANSVTEAAVALNRFSKTWQELGGRPQVAKSFEILTNKEQLNLLKEARNEADAYSRSLSEANKKNQAETKASTNAIKEQMQAEKNRHDENIARLKQEGSSIKIMSSSYRDYVSAITMSEQTETSRTKKIERMNTVLEELRKKESEYSVEIDVLTRKINSLTKENERLAASRQNSQKALEAQAKLESKLRRSNYQSYVTSTEGSLRTADKANTYAQRAQAIKNLEAAIKKLRTTDANYQNDLKRLSDAHKRLSAEQKKVEANFRSIQGTQHNLMNTSDQLARKLALIFSVSQIEGYVNKLVRVRGEFELQNTALASILQNKDKADKLFGQITDLAVKSPFTLKELVTYTKSLSAYSVEYEKLYDTTKMLADVSSGLGVDMQRIILAFGQVKAANFLRGTETRQFTEAGINMLGELAKYYSELEGRMVSVGEVQERQFKRMISFQDVEEVFKRLTSAGGMFYNMQERQAETLAGMMSNLQDSIDIMLNDIGKGNESVIKDIIKNIRSIIENWREVAWYLEKISTAFVVYKGAAMLASLGNNAFVKSLFQLNKTSIPALRNIAAMKNALLALGRGVASAGVLLLVSWLIDLYRQATKTSRELEELGKSLNKITSTDASNLNKMVAALDDLIARLKLSNEGSQERRDIISSLNNNYGEYLDFVVDETTSIKDLTDAYDGVVKKMKEKAALATLEKGYQEINQFYEENVTDARKQFEKELSRGLSSDLGFGGFKKSIKPTKDEINDLFNILQNRIRETDDSLLDSSREQRNLLQDIVKEYYGNGVILSQDYLKTVPLIDLFHEKKKKEEELQNNINGAYKETLRSREANIALTKRENQLELEKEAINNQQLSSFDTKRKIQEAIEKFELDKIDIKVKFGEISQQEAKRQKDVILNWATNTVKDVNARLREELKGYSEEDLSKVLIGKEEQATGISSIRQTVKQNWETQVSIIEQLTKLKENNISVDEQLLANAQKLKVMYETKARILGVELESKKESVKSDNSALQRLKDQIALIKKAGDEYEKLRKYYSEDEAKKRVVDALKEEAKQKGVESIFMSAEFDDRGTLASMEKVKAMYKNMSQEMKIAFAEAFGGIELQLDIDVQENRVKEIQNQFSDLFGNYELSLELDNLGLDKNLASQLFGVEVFDLAELRKQLEPFKKELQTTLGKDGVSAWEEMDKKISEMEAKELQERLKTYSQYLKQSVSERVKIEMEAQKKIAEVRATEEFTPEQQERIVTQIRQETQVKKDEQAWKGFQDSELYIKMFEDLEFASTKALDAMEQKLIEVRNSLKTLSPTELKQINDQLEKIREVKISRNPFEGLKDNIKVYIEYLKKAKDLNDKFIESQTKQDDLSKLYDNQLMVRNEIEAQYAASVKVNGEGSKESLLLKEKLTQQDKILDVTLKQLVAQGKITQEFAEQIRAGEQLGSNAQKQINNIGSIGSQVVSSISEFTGMLSNWGIEFGETFEGVLSGIGQAFDGLNKIDITRPMSIVSGAVSVVSGIGNAFASIFGFGNKDKKKEKEIERQIEQVEKLQKAYEKLEKAIDDAYSIDTYKEANDQAIANLKAQNASLQASIAAEQDKKKTDDDRIKEWRQQIEDNNEAIEELLKEQFSQVTGGILDDILSAANDFTDAWLESFKEVGDGMDGLEENFQEMLTNMLKQQASMLITNTFLENWKKQLEKYINADDLELTTDEAKKWVDSVESSLPALNEALENYFKAMQDAGLDLSGEGGDTMTGLEKGISSITENTAEVLASITESIRYFTSDSNTVLHNIYNLMINPPVENPFLSELKVQSEQLRLLYGLFNGIIKNVSGSGKAMSVRIV